MTTRPSDDTTLTLPAARTRRGFRRLTLLALALAVAGVVFWTGVVRSGTGPAVGTSLNGPSSAVTRTGASGTSPATDHGQAIMVGTFNIHGCVGQSGKQNLDLTADCLRELDLAGLNEVHGTSPFQTHDQAELLGGKVGAAWLFAPSETRWWHPHHGNGVLSRLPVTYWARFPLPCTAGRGLRNVTLVKLAHEGRTINVLITHLDTRQDRPAQLRAVSELFLSLAEPAILMGDLNTAPDDPQIGRLLATPGVAEAVATALGPKAPRRIDWIFVRGLKCLDGGLLDRQASDHPMAWAKLAIAP